MRCLWNGLRTFARRFSSPSEQERATPALPHPASPCYFVRACDFSNSISLVRDVEAATKASDELDSLAVECFFGDETRDLSVYAAPTADCFEPALASVSSPA